MGHHEGPGLRLFAEACGSPGKRQQWWLCEPGTLFSQDPIWTNGLQRGHSYRSILAFPSTLSHPLCQAVIQILVWMKKGVKGARSLLVQALSSQSYSAALGETPSNPAQRSLIQPSAFIYTGIYLTHSSYNTYYVLGTKHCKYLPI